MAITHAKELLTGFATLTTWTRGDASATVTCNATAIAREIVFKVDNQGTPAAGDTVDFYLLGSTGDPDGTGTAEFTSVGHGLHLCTVDTNIEDPAVSPPCPLPVALEAFQIYAYNNGAQSMVVSGRFLESRSA